MAWSDLFTAEKRVKSIAGLLAATVAIAGTCYAAYDHFSTDAERKADDAKLRKALEEHEQTVVVSNNRAEIWRAKREIKRLERDRIHPDNTDLDNALIESDIKEYQDLIDCIREGKELCY